MRELWWKMGKDQLNEKGTIVNTTVAMILAVIVLVIVVYFLISNSDAMLERLWDIIKPK